MGNHHFKTVSVGSTFSFRFNEVKQFLVTDPVHLPNVAIQAELGHKGNGTRFHRVVVCDFAGGEEVAVVKCDLRVATIKVGPRVVVLLCYPVVVSSFFASISEEARFFLAIEVEALITIEQLVYFINAIILKSFRSDDSEVPKVRKFLFNTDFSRSNSCNISLTYLWLRLSFYFFTFADQTLLLGFLDL